MQKPPFLRLLTAFTCLLIAAPHVRAQSSSGPSEPSREPGGRVILILPFDNRSGQPALNWIGDSFPDTLNQRLGSSGFLTISRDDREFALDHLGLPTDFRPSRATTLRIAQNLDANYVIVGSFNVKDNRIMVQAQILEVNRLRLSAPIEDSSDLPRLFDIENALAWKIARQVEPTFSVAQQTFLSASAGIRLSAFENYIRGTDATIPTERVKRLEVAVLDAPNYSAALLALGKQYYLDRDYDKAAATLAKVPPNDRQALEANFYLGLARFNTAKYADAENAFAFVASRLPLPEVVNDQAVAQSRQNKDAQPLFLRASQADPNDPDYHYNLAATYYRRGDFANSQRELDQTLKLRPTDIEAAQLRTAIASARSTTLKAPGSGFEPTTRIRRTYSEAGFRQAAFQLDQVRAMRLATLPPVQQATEYVQLGRDYMAQGLLPEAEEQFQSAIAAQPNNAAAHAGLAQVREQSGSADDARTEAQTSLRLAPSPAAYIVLAKLDQKQNNLTAATTEVQSALKLDPRNPEALALRQSLQSQPLAQP